MFAPEFLLEEFSKHREFILVKSKRSEERFSEILEILKSLITIVPMEEFEDCLEKAIRIASDKDDALYFALALKLNCTVWSNEKRLKNQKSVIVYSTEGLLKLFSQR